MAGRIALARPPPIARVPPAAPSSRHKHVHNFTDSLLPLHEACREKMVCLSVSDGFAAAAVEGGPYVHPPPYHQCASLSPMDRVSA